MRAFGKADVFDIKEQTTIVHRTVPGTGEHQKDRRKEKNDPTF